MLYESELYPELVWRYERDCLDYFGMEVLDQTGKDLCEMSLPGMGDVDRCDMERVA